MKRRWFLRLLPAIPTALLAAKQHTPNEEWYGESVMEFIHEAQVERTRQIEIQMMWQNEKVMAAMRRQMGDLMYGFPDG